VLGGFTTFSSFSLDTITLLQNGDFSSAFLNVFLTVAGCLLATAGGLFLTRALFLLF
jgi:CrcB protein